MSIFTIIANFINAILAFMGAKPDIKVTGPDTTYTGGEQTSKGQKSGNRCMITIPEHINNHFFDTGSDAWVNQVFTVKGKTYRGIHGGVDMGAPNGSPVFAPYDMHIVAIGHYNDSGRMGDYVIGNLNDGTEYYSGHLANPRVNVGDDVKCGEQIAEIGYYNHTHIQMKQGGEVIDPEEYLK